VPMRQEIFTTPTPVTLDLRVPAGEIEIEALPGAVETTVALEPLSGDEAVRAVETAIVELRHDEVRVEVRDDGGWGDTPQVRVVVRCPERPRLVVATASADLHARGGFAAAELATASGDFELDHIEGELRAKAASGDLTFGSVAGDARIRTASGDVDIDCAESSLDVQTASGDQRVGEVASGRITLKSASGDVEVGVRPGVGVWVDARSLSGDTTSDLDLGGDSGDHDGPTVELKAVTMSGDVQISRADARAKLQQ
jgi:putative adhesin